MVFTVGDRVQTKAMKSSKKKPRHGVIIRAVEGAKKHTWEVKLDDNPDENEIKTSKMLMQPNADPPTVEIVTQQINNLVVNPPRCNAVQPPVARTVSVNDEALRDEDSSSTRSADSRPSLRVRRTLLFFRQYCCVSV